MEVNTGAKAIREHARQLLEQSRRSKRDDESNYRRRIQSTGTTPEDVTVIVEKLKTKSSISVSELKTLKNALMIESSVIETVLNTHGALRGIVRELIGQEVAKQLEASDSLCNIALGDVRACTAVAKAAGPYLVARLDNTTSKLSVNCAYTLGTLSASGSKVSELLTTQGALSALTRLLTSNCEEMQAAALYAVTHFVVQLKDDLSAEHMSEIALAVSKLKLHKEVQKLLFTLTCHDEFVEHLPNELLDELVRMLLQDLAVSVQNHLLDCPVGVVCCKLLYTLRILANLVSREENSFISRRFENNCDMFCELLTTNNEFVKESALWFLGNLYNINKNSVIVDMLMLKIKH